MKQIRGIEMVNVRFAQKRVVLFSDKANGLSPSKPVKCAYLPFLGQKGGIVMSSALLSLRERSQSCSSTERGVAERILENPQLVVDMSVHELARQTFSSPSTIVRLCSHTGYSGYKEFRKAVTYELTLREQNKKTQQKEIARSDSLEEIIEKVTYLNIISLEETKELLDVQVLRAWPMVPSARSMAGIRYFMASSKALPVRSAISCTEAGAKTSTWKSPWPGPRVARK